MKKNIVFYGENLKLTKNNTFSIVFSNRIFPCYDQFFEND